MRSDFSKVLTERPRRGGLYAYKTVRHRNKVVSDDDYGGKEGMRRPYGYDQKEFTDLISPLWRFLQSRVGARWDDVYSEICQTIKGRNTTQQHLLDHVDQYVGQGNWRRWSDFSIDENGILRMRPQHRRARYVKPVPKDTVETDDGRMVKRYDGIWFEVHWTQEERAYWIPETCTSGRWTVTVEHKRQLATKELRTLGLANLPR